MKTTVKTAADCPVRSRFERVGILSPLLPKAGDILPYLERIDASRWYSNFGPLVVELQDRMCAHFRLNKGEALTTSNGTAGLISTLRAMNLPKDSYCLMPSWTFVATPAAAIAAGMTPYFVDVDDESWALDPEYVREMIQDIKGVIGAIIVVAPFGKIVDIEAWDSFSADTSIPVVIDAAAGFDWFKASTFGATPVVISLHATKVFGAGEGGMVLSRDHTLMRHVQEQSNFGFYTRHISTPGINCKMSEYTAAVAHAALDIWPQQRQQWEQITRHYIKLLEPIADKHGLTMWLDKDNVVSTCNIRLADNKADEVISRLRTCGIKARRWWDDGCHRQPAYTSFPSADLSVTEKLAASLVSLPFYMDIPEKHISFIMEKLAEILND